METLLCLDGVTSIPLLLIQHELSSSNPNLDANDQYITTVTNSNFIICHDDVCVLYRCSNLEKLHIDGTLTCLPQEIGHLSRLTHLEVDGMLESLPSSFSLLKSLAHLSLRGKKNTNYECFMS